MNVARSVKVEATEHGVRLRLWVDDVEGRHLTVAELDIPAPALVEWVRACDREQQRANQYQLHFDN